MADREVTQLVQQLNSLNAATLTNAPRLLSQAKIALLKLDALVPSSKTSPAHLALGQSVLEAGALLSIRQRDPDAFTRYFQQLQPFYSLPSSSAATSNRSKVTGLYLLLLLSQGDYAGFHTEIERLGTLRADATPLESDPFIAYPLRLEQALMEGSYDRVWGETKGNRVPGEEFGVFSEVRYMSVQPLASITDTFTGPHQHHPRRDSILQRARLPLPPHQQRKEPPLPRIRGRSGRIRPLKRLGRTRRTHILPRRRRRSGRGEQRRGRGHRPGY